MRRERRIRKVTGKKKQGKGENEMRDEGKRQEELGQRIEEVNQRR